MIKKYLKLKKKLFTHFGLKCLSFQFEEKLLLSFKTKTINKKPNQPWPKLLYYKRKSFTVEFVQNSQLEFELNSN